MNPAGFPQSGNIEKPKRKQYFHDGEAWVYAFEQPPMKKKAEPVVLEDVVKKAILTNVLENMEKGKYNVTPQFKDNGRRKKNKPEADRCLRLQRGPPQFKDNGRRKKNKPEADRCL